jgi:putative FmdB family regulatory protein
MPIYTARCAHCQNEQDYYSSVDERNQTPLCDKCDSHTQKIFSTYKVIPDIESYVDHNLTDHPVRVNSKKHREQLMKKYKVYESYGKGWH